MNYYIEFNPKYTKIEGKLLRKIILDFNKKKKNFYNLDELESLNIKNDTESFFNKFSKKSIIYCFNEKKGIINPISHFIFYGNTIEFYLTSFFEDILLDKNEFKILNLKSTLLFNEHFSKNFYYIFMCKNLEKKEFLITLEEFKDSLGISEYERYYDFEKYILKPLKKDIDENSDYILKFEKYKKNDYINSKVTGIIFKIIEKNYQDRINTTNLLMSMITVKINDYKGLFDMIYKSLNIFLKTEIEEFIIKSIHESKKSKKNFEELLNTYLNKKNNHELIAEFQKKFSSPIELENSLSEVLRNAKKPNFLEREFSSTQFLMKLYFSKEGEELRFQKDNILIIIKYYKKSLSFVSIYEVSK